MEDDRRRWKVVHLHAALLVEGLVDVEVVGLHRTHWPRDAWRRRPRLCQQTHRRQLPARRPCNDTVLAVALVQLLLVQRTRARDHLHMLPFGFLGHSRLRQWQLAVCRPGVGAAGSRRPLSGTQVSPSR